MKLKADLFPYPVMNPDLDDYVDNNSFQFDLVARTEGNNAVVIDATLQLDNKGLKALITSGKAAFALHLEGIGSSYRKLCIDVEKTNFIQERIYADQSLPKKLQVNGMIIATENIYDYTNETFNTNFYGESYVVNSIQKGEILAFRETEEVVCEFTNKQTNEESIFEVSTHDKPHIDVDLATSRARLRLPKEVFAYYKNWGNTSQEKDALLSMLFVPVLTYMIGEIKADRVYDKELEWYQVIEEILNEQDINIDNANTLELAQHLLNYPIIRAIELKDNEDEEDGT